MADNSGGAYSVPANIVEGFARRYRSARLHFLNIAESSLAEAHYCVHAAHRLGYISDEVHAELETDLNSVGAPLSGLVRSTRLLPAVISGFTLLCGILVGSWLW